MPSVRELVGTHELGYSAWAWGIPRCFGWAVPHGIYTQAEVEAAVVHALTHRVHRSRSRNGQNVVSAATRTVGIGADPEFVFVGIETNHVISASWYINDPQRRNQLGVDGHSITGELRPSWGKASECFMNLDALLADLRDIIGNRAVQVNAGACVDNEPLGGHIHVSGAGREPSDALIRAVDQFIAEPLNSVSASALRRSRGHGRAREWRRQNHGFEFRSPPSWLAHPVLALGALTIVEVLARQEQLRPVQTWEQLLELCTTGGEVAAIEGFRLKIFALQQEGAQLETLDVMKAWGKVPSIGGVQRVVTPQVSRTTVWVRMGDFDSFTYESEVLSSRLGNTVLPARSSRQGESGRGVFLPQVLCVPELSSRLESVICDQHHMTVAVHSWEREGLGLSWNLRADLSREQIRNIVEEVRREIQ